MGKHDRPEEDKLITPEEGHTINVDTIDDLNNMQLDIQKILCKEMFSYYKTGEFCNLLKFSYFPNNIYISIRMFFDVILQSYY